MRTQADIIANIIVEPSPYNRGCWDLVDRSTGERSTFAAKSVADAERQRILSAWNDASGEAEEIAAEEAREEAAANGQFGVGA